MVSVLRLCVLILLLVSCCESWRRRRRVSSLGDSEARRKRSISCNVHPVFFEVNLKCLLKDRGRQETCRLHGEYKIIKGKIRPAVWADSITNIQCNNQRCWKGDYCWECRLKSGTNKYERLTQNNMDDLACEDAQCPLGRRDTRFYYYSLNDTRTLPHARGPFHCNRYICMTSQRCWKCRLNSDSIDFETVNEGKEFHKKVTCCPIPKLLTHVSTAKFFKMGHSRMTNNDDVTMPGLDDDEDDMSELIEPVEYSNSNAIDVDLKANKLITNIHIYGKGAIRKKRFTIAYSSDGKKDWTNYEEYNTKALFYSNHRARSHTLFKPFLARYLTIKPIDSKKVKQIIVGVYGCDLLLGKKKKAGHEGEKSKSKV
eukprot:gene8052-8915_t